MAARSRGERVREAIPNCGAGAVACGQSRKLFSGGSGIISAGTMTGPRGASAGLGQQAASVPRARPRKRGPKLSRGIDLRGEYRGGAPRGERARSADEWQHSSAWRASATAFALSARRAKRKRCGQTAAPFGAPPSPRFISCMIACGECRGHVVPLKIRPCACDGLARDARWERSLASSLRAERSNPALNASGPWIASSP
jgi:hypothetical protein